jgi:internalin A
MPAERRERELAGLERLQSLGLAGTQISDAGLKSLAGLKQLRTLNLAGTRITDVGLQELIGLKQLQSLQLFNTHVTDAGVAEFHKASVLAQRQAIPRWHPILPK